MLTLAAIEDILRRAHTMDFLHVITIRLNIAEQIPNTSEAKKIVFAAMLT